MFDAIVVGSGISGGWVAKELTEKGLKVLVLERGPNIVHGEDYKDGLMPWEHENGGRVPEDEVRTRLCRPEHRLSVQQRQQGLLGQRPRTPLFDRRRQAVHLDPGFPPRRPLADVGTHVAALERSRFRRQQEGRPWFGLADPLCRPQARGTTMSRHLPAFRDRTAGLSQLPDGDFLPPMGLNDVEADFKKKIEASFPGRTVIPPRVANLTEVRDHQAELGRGPCQFRSQCHNGCSFGAYFSSLSATLPAAGQTGNLTVITDAIVHSVIHDPKTNRVTGVRVIDARTKKAHNLHAQRSCSSTHRPSRPRRSCSIRRARPSPMALPTARTWSAAT